MLDVFEAAAEWILDNRLAWPASHVDKAIEGIHWMVINCGSDRPERDADGSEPNQVHR